MKFTQIPADTFQHLQLNAGVLLKSFDPNTATLNKSDIIGATSGGVQFTASPSYSDWGEDIDNCPTNVKELKKLDGWEVSMSGTYLTVSASQAKDLIGAADIDSSDPTHIIPRNDVLEGDFADIWWVGDYSDKNGATNGGFIAIHLLNGLSTGGFQMQSANKGKGNFSFEITGHYSIDDTEKVPFEVFVKSGSAEA